MINPDMSEAIFSGSYQGMCSFLLLSSINLEGTAMLLSDTVGTLGVTVDNKLTFQQHITNLCKFCFYHIRAIRHIRSALTKNMSQTTACSLVSSHLDYSCLLFVGLSDFEHKRMQCFQNSSASVPVSVPKEDTFSHPDLEFWRYTHC